MPIVEIMIYDYFWDVSLQFGDKLEFRKTPLSIPYEYCALILMS